jgi:hypothetical protein
MQQGLGCVGSFERHLLGDDLAELVGGDAAHVVVHRGAHRDRRLGHIHPCARATPAGEQRAAGGPAREGEADRRRRSGIAGGGRAPAKMAAVSEMPGRRSLSTCPPTPPPTSPRQPRCGTRAPRAAAPRLHRGRHFAAAGVGPESGRGRRLTAAAAPEDLWPLLTHRC